MQNSNQLIYKKYTVSGRVQGVFYRQSTQEQATQLGLVGWVQNLSNGDVMVWTKGHIEQIHQLEQWLKIGPPKASVSAVVTVELTQAETAHLDKLVDFTIAR